MVKIKSLMFRIWLCDYAIERIDNALREIDEIESRDCELYDTKENKSRPEDDGGWNAEEDGGWKSNQNQIIKTWQQQLTN